ncbi:hypothetical protein [Micromonospora sp. SL4-19]|uniref:hypothetical protein n=1 Tax=Micromonospora sp. SL4-19 TaxID=3399129 RepID=UPI003A4DBF0A
MRRTAALCLVLAPVALAVATGVDPALGDDQGYGVYRAHPEAIQWHSLLLHWAWVLFVPGLLGLLQPIRQRGAVLARISWVAIVLGLVSFSALMAFDLILLAWVQNLPDDAVSRVDTAFQGMPWATYGWQMPGLVGWALALVLTPITAARGRVVSWWTAALALAGVAGYVAFAVSPVPLNLTGPLLLVVAYGAAAWRLLRAPAGAGEGRAAEPDRYGTFRRRAGVVAMVAAPLAFAAGMATVPNGTGDPLDHLRQPTTTQVSGFLLHLGWMLFLPAVLAMVERGRAFTRIAGVVTAIGLINFSALMLGDFTDLVARQQLEPAQADAVDVTFGGYTLFSLGWVLPGMLLTFVGLLAVTVSAAADRVVRWWLPGLVAAGLAAFFMLGLGLLGVVGPLLLLVGFGLAARKLMRTGPRPQLSTVE